MFTLKTYVNHSITVLINTLSSFIFFWKIVDICDIFNSVMIYN